jgi:hypothetical protein
MVRENVIVAGVYEKRSLPHSDRKQRKYMQERVRARYIPLRTHPWLPIFSN